MNFRTGMCLLVMMGGLSACATGGGAYEEPVTGPVAEVSFSWDSSVPGMGVSHYEGANCINPAIMRATDRPDDPTRFKVSAGQDVTLFVRTGAGGGFGQRGWYCVIGVTFRPVAGGNYRFQLSRQGGQCRLLAEQRAATGWQAIEGMRLRTYRTPVVASEGFCEPLK